MQQHLGRQAGVARVDVNLLDGKVAVHLKDDNRFDPATVLTAAFDSGITVEEMTITASGELEREAGKLRLRVSPAQSFEVALAAAGSVDSQAGTGATLRVRGLLYQRSKDTRKNKKAPFNLRFTTLELLGREDAR